MKGEKKSNCEMRTYRQSKINRVNDNRRKYQIGRVIRTRRRQIILTYIICINTVYQNLVNNLHFIRPILSTLYRIMTGFIP
jgi:hypothetical protein